MKKKKCSLLLNLTIVFYSVYAIKCVWLAFASVNYFPAYYYILEVSTMSCLPFGIAVVILPGKLFVPKNYWLLILPFIYWIYNFVNSYTKPNLAIETFTLGVIVIFVLFRSEIKARIFDTFYWLIQICNVFSLVFFLLYQLNINIGFETVPYYEPNIPANYVKWLIFGIYKSSTELRLCGIFNEPGALGTVCSLLFIVKFNKCRLWEILLLIAVILCTYSLAGYLLMFIFLALYLVRKNPKNLIFLSLFIGAFLFIPHIDFGNEYLNHLASRLAFTKDGLAGDNRTKPYFDELYHTFMQSNDRWFGYGNNYPMGSGTLSYKTYVVEYGILGFGFWIFTWICSGINVTRMNKDCLIFLSIFLISLYQRPRLIASIYGYVLLFGGMEWIKENQKKVVKIY
ncbi:MAG: hypothetical protein K2H19_09295 [Ruminococcus sp.]|nr:hypothetical protein [Ruminococcus sp.]